MPKLDARQIKVLIFVALTAGFVGALTWRAFREPTAEEIEAEYQRILSEDRKSIEAEIEKPDVLVQGTHLQSLLRLSQVQDPLVLEAALKWKNEPNPELIAIMARGLGPFVISDERSREVLEEMFIEGTTKHKLAVMDAILYEISERRLELAQKFLLRWPKDQKNSFSYLRATLNYLKIPKKIKQENLKRDFQNTLKSFDGTADEEWARVKMDDLRLLLEDYVAMDGVLDQSTKENLKAVYEKIPFDERLEGSSAERTRTLLGL